MPGSPHVLLLRAVNVGGRNRLPMKDLAAMVAALGGSEVRTYIQSGNACCRIPPDRAPELARRLGEEILARFGFSTPVILRTGAELARILAEHPFAGQEDQLHVAFLEALPDPDRAARMDPERSPGDRFELRGREIFLQLPRGVGQSKLSNDWLERQLGSPCTVRNWRTVGALEELCRGVNSPSAP